MVAATRHDEFAAEDYARLKAFGMGTAREGIRWPLIARAGGPLDFSSAIPLIEASRRAGVEIVWDLLHFGWPDGLDVFKPEWLDAFTALAHGFARVLRKNSDPPYWIAPVNEISFVSWAGGDVAYLNPFERGRGPELKTQLVRGFIAAARAVREEIPQVKLVSPEPAIHIVGRPDVPGDEASAEGYRQSMFEAWDMILGRRLPELGGSEDLIDTTGVNFYDRNEWFNYGPTIVRSQPEYRPFSRILREVWERYRRPLFVSETGTEGDDRPAWFAYIAQEVRSARAAGAQVEGICLYPVVDHPGWDDDRHCPNGLWGYADDTGHRPIYEPLADEIRREMSL